MAILNNSNAISSGGYDINNSLRFRSSASAYLSKTLSTPTNNKKWTWSGWVKRSTLTTTQVLFATASEELRYISDGGASGVVDSFQYNAGAGYGFRASATYRDVSAWYHLVIATDTTQATAANRVKFYVNGVQATTDGTYDITQNTNTQINSAVAHNIGRRNSGSLYFDGYMTEINFVDGQQLTPSSFGETDTTTGSWKPKAYTGTYGTNGFYLKFSDIATTSGSNAGLGKDFSGNANYWTTNNISVTAGTTYDAMIDSPTLTSATVANYAVMNPLSVVSPTTIANGNLDVTTGTTGGGGAFSTIAIPTSGKYYFEFLPTSATTVSDNIRVGVSNSTVGSYVLYKSDGNKVVDGSTTSYGATFTTNDTIGCAIDVDGGTITFYKNNSSQGAITYATNSGNFFAYTQDGSGVVSVVASFNFGQRPFTYTPPTGYNRLNTYNLPTSTIVQGNKYMDATLWTGNGTNAPNALTVTNAGGFKPDLVWIKIRSGADIHNLQDSVRTLAYRLSSNNTNGDSATGGGDVSSLNSNGFTISYNNNWTNANGSTYVGWQWQAGQGSTSSGTGTGGITSVTMSVNASAGFSIQTFTIGTITTAGTITHGLGVAPKFIITKARTGTVGWSTYHASLGNTQYVQLNTTAAAATLSTAWNNTSPDSTIWTVGSAFGGLGTYVAYCWAEIAGFSKFGSYTGNGSNDGPFVYTGFRPKFVIFKRTNAVSDWVIYDSTRNTYNVVNTYLQADLSAAEGTLTSCDFVSNGFKVRSTDVSFNGSGDTYIYAAFAENPFKNANAR